MTSFVPVRASAAASCGLRLRARARALRRARGTTRFLRDRGGSTASVSTTWGTLSLAAPLSPPVRQLLAVGRHCVKFVRSVHRPAALPWRGYRLRSWCDSVMAWCDARDSVLCQNREHSPYFSFGEHTYGPHGTPRIARIARIARISTD